MKVTIGPYPKNSKTERKVSIHIDGYDTWNMDDTLAMIILPMLKQLKKAAHGAPNTDDEDVPEALRSTSAPKKKKEWDVDKFHFKRWNWILTEMIWAFAQKNTNWESKFHKGKIDTLWQALDKDHKPIGKPEKLKARKKAGAVTYRTVKGPKDTHVFDKEGYTKHQARMSNGFRLFGKYYENLWD